MLLLEPQSIRGSREISREKALLALPLLIIFPGYLFLATVLVEFWARLTLRFGLRWLSWFTRLKWKWQPESTTPRDSLGIQVWLWGQLWNPTHRPQGYCTYIYGFETWATRTHKKRCLGIVLPTLLLQPLPNSPAHHSPLSCVRKQLLGSFGACLQGTAESTWLLGSVGCPRTAPYHEKPRQPCQRATPSLTTPRLQHCRRIPVHSSTIFREG